MPSIYPHEVEPGHIISVPGNEDTKYSRGSSGKPRAPINFRRVVNIRPLEGNYYIIDHAEPHESRIHLTERVNANDVGPNYERDYIHAKEPIFLHYPGSDQETGSKKSMDGISEHEVGDRVEFIGTSPADERLPPNFNTTRKLPVGSVGRIVEIGSANFGDPVSLASESSHGPSSGSSPRPIYKVDFDGIVHEGLIGTHLSPSSRSSQYGGVDTRDAKAMDKDKNKDDPNWGMEEVDENTPITTNRTPQESQERDRRIRQGKLERSSVRNRDNSGRKAMPNDMNHLRQNMQTDSEQMSPEQEQPQNPEQEGMQPEPELQGSTQQQQPQQVEKLSAQALRRVHEDQEIMLQEYDEILNHLEDEETKQFIQRKLQTIVQELEEIEDIFARKHPELSPPGQSQEPNQQMQPSPEQENLEQESDDPIEADSARPKEVPEEEAIEGMRPVRKNLNGWMTFCKSQGLCPNCGKSPCGCTQGKGVTEPNSSNRSDPLPKRRPSGTMKRGGGMQLPPGQQVPSQSNASASDIRKSNKDIRVRQVPGGYQSQVMVEPIDTEEGHVLYQEPGSLWHESEVYDNPESARHYSQGAGTHTANAGRPVHITDEVDPSRSMSASDIRKTAGKSLDDSNESGSLLTLLAHELHPIRETHSLLGKLANTDNFGDKERYESHSRATTLKDIIHRLTNGNPGMLDEVDMDLVGSEKSIPCDLNWLKEEAGEEPVHSNKKD